MGTPMANFYFYCVWVMGIIVTAGKIPELNRANRPQLYEIGQFYPTLSAPPILV